MAPIFADEFYVMVHNREIVCQMSQKEMNLEIMFGETTANQACANLFLCFQKNREEYLCTTCIIF